MRILSHPLVIAEDVDELLLCDPVDEADQLVVGLFHQALSASDAVQRDATIFGRALIVVPRLERRSDRAVVAQACFGVPNAQELKVFHPRLIHAPIPILVLCRSEELRTFRVIGRVSFVSSELGRLKGEM
jgi:hypothetical protein